jgi:hypothetical protein
MQRDPGGEAVAVSADAGVVLMGVDDASFVVWKDETDGRLRVDEQIRAGEKLHYVLKFRQMRERVKRLELVNAIVDVVVGSVSVHTGGCGNGEAFVRIGRGMDPSCCLEDE